MDDGGQEDNTRIGIATEDSDNAEMAPGDVPMTASGIIDTAAVSEPAQLRAIQQISLSTSDRTINVLTGNNILNEDNMVSYFTSAFPTIFPWGTGKHIDSQHCSPAHRMGTVYVTFKRTCMHKSFKYLELKQLLWKAARATTEVEFKQYMDAL